MTIREDALAIVNPPLMHEDELIDFMHARATAILDALNAAPHDVALDAASERFIGYRIVPDPAPGSDVAGAIQEDSRA